MNQNFTFTGKDASKLKRGNRERTSFNSKKSAPDNGGHLVRGGRRFYRTYHISVWFDRQTDILREVWLLSPRNRVGGDIVTRPFVDGWVSGFVGGCVRGSVMLYLVDTIATTVFVQSISNFTCTFAMMRGGTLLSFCPIHFKFHMHIRHDERRNPIDFGSKVKVNFGTQSLCIRTCGHNTDCSFCPITFKHHM